METLAFIHAHVDYEDPNPVPEMRSLEEIRTAIVHSLWTSLAGGATVSVLIAAPEAQAVVRRGDACAAVGNVQTALQQRGFSTGGTDSVFGGSTEFAVLQFQRRNGLSADGVVGPATATALGLSATISCGTTATNTGSTATPSTSTTGNYRVEAADGLNVRSGPGAGFPVIGGLANAAIVQAGTVNNGYRQLSTGGWVASQYLVPTTSTAPTPAVGTATAPFAVSTTTGTTSSPASTATTAYRVSVSSGLNVRSGPGAGFPVVSGLANGAIVQAGTTSNGYRQLSTGGWVASQYLVPANSSSASSGGSGGSGGGGGGGTPRRTARINTNGGVLNVRSGPGAGYSVAGTLADRASVQTTGRIVGDWLELANGRWVASRWVQR
jgi:peptidoglycan hydrolase-like protein with peptidoglycan-binding domain